MMGALINYNCMMVSFIIHKSAFGIKVLAAKYVPNMDKICGTARYKAVWHIIYSWKICVKMLLLDDGNTIQLQLDDGTIHHSQVSILRKIITCKICAKSRQNMRHSKKAQPKFTPGEYVSKCCWWMKGTIFSCKWMIVPLIIQSPPTRGSNLRPPNG
jgi:hypothetical protein